MDKIILPDSDEDLLAECDIETFRAGGKGGQHQNRRESGVRLRHRPSGVVAEYRRERSQYQNKKVCLALIRLKIEKRNYRAPKRVKTRMPMAVKFDRLQAKTQTAKKKQLRKPPGIDRD